MIGEILRLGGTQRLLTAAARVPGVVMLGISLLLVLLLGLLQYSAANPLGWVALYLLPIAIATWFVGARPGALIVFLSAGTTYFISSQQANLRDAAWNAVSVWIVGTVVAELLYSVKLSQEVSKQLSRIDSATGAVNSRFFNELLEAEFHRAERYRFALTVAYIHLQDFSQTSGRRGQQAGEELLYQFVAQLSEALRANDVVARLGGEHFALLLPQTNDLQAQQVFARLQPQMKEALASEAESLNYRIAVVTFLEMPEMVEEVMEQAETLSQSSSNHSIEYLVLP